AAAAGLRQPVCDLCLCTYGVGLAAAGQPGGIAGRVPTQVGHGKTESSHHVIEDVAEQVEVGDLSEDGEEAGDVPPVGNAVFALDADEQTQGCVAPELFEAGLGGGVAEEDG